MRDQLDENEFLRNRRKQRSRALLFVAAMLVVVVGLTCKKSIDIAFPEPRKTEADSEPSTKQFPEPSGIATEGEELGAGAVAEVEIPKTPCEQVDRAEDWELGELKAVHNEEDKPLGFSYTRSLRIQWEGEWIDCPEQQVKSIQNKRDWDEAWKVNHPIRRRAPLKKFDNKWAMEASPLPPLFQLPQHSESVGLPHDGVIEHGAHLPIERASDYPYFLQRDPERAGFSTHSMEAFVVAMQQAFQQLGEAYEGLQFVLLDASAVTGGKLALQSNENKFHGSHQSGRDVDIAAALRDKETGAVLWAYANRSKKIANSDRTLSLFLKRIGKPSLGALTLQIRKHRKKQDLRRKKRGKKPVRRRKTAKQTARARAELWLGNFVYDAVWTLVVKAWLPGHLRWAFLDKREQRLLYRAAKRAKHRVLADAIMSYDPRRGKYRRHNPTRCLHQPGESGHDVHIHFRFNCGENETRCADRL